MQDKDSDFPDELAKALADAGWYPGRRIDISDYVHDLQNDGYEVSAQVREFLTEFGGIIVPTNKMSAEIGRPTLFHFRVRSATASVGLTLIQKYMEQVGAALCVIGEANNDYETLTMDPNGRVYGGFTESLAFYGATGREALINLLYSKGTTVP